jgi:outer membrane protein assembly factor BamE
MRLALIAFAVPLLAACNPVSVFSVYRMEVQQGNFLTQEMASQLKAGMTKDQVRFVLGTPLVSDIFHDTRWDYVYRLQQANSSQVEERRLSVFFEDGKLVRLEGDVTPGSSIAAKSNLSQGGL